MPNDTNRKMATVAMLVATFLVAIDVTVVSTAMPRVVSDLSGLNLISWVFAIYTLTTSVTTPIYGKLADLYGRKVIFIIGVILFLLGSVLSGAAHSMTQLIWFRAFQGIGAGAVFPVTFTIIGDLYPGEQRAKMSGIFSSIWGIAGLLGPLVGGFFVDHVTWRWIFYINLPVGLVSIVLISVFFHETFAEKKSHKIDFFGAISFIIGISSLLYALLNGGPGQKYAWNSGPIYFLFTVALIFIVLFVFLETRVKEPMLPPTLFKIPAILVSNVIGFLAAGVIIGVNVYLPMWIQILLGHSATSSGLTLMPMSFAWPIGATFAGRYMYKIGSKLTAVIGGVLVLLGGTWLLALSLNSPYWYFVGLMIVIELGMGYSMTPTTVLVQSAVGWEMRGAATASNTFMRTIGQTVAVAVFGTIFNNAIIHNANSMQGGSHKGGSLNSLMESGNLSKLPLSVQHMIKENLANALHHVFILVFILGMGAFVMTLFLPLHSKILEQQKQAQN